MTQEQANAIADILRREYEVNPTFRAVMNAKAVAADLSAEALAAEGAA
jgi:hypothetical protein